MAGIPSRMNQTAREQVLATDLNRIGDLAGRELMDSKLLRSVRADFYKPATNTFDDFSAVSKAAQATPIAGLTRPPSLDGIAAVFDMALGAGEGQLPFTSANPDQSDYQLLRWPAQTLTWPGGGTPDATNPLICLICATPADQLTDLQSRNILLDPILRSVSPQNCYKTTNSLATISVIAGAAAPAPVPPAVPAGALALFEVYVPAAVADSTSFLPVRRAWRQIEFPGTSQHGIVKGCVPYLGLGTPYLNLGLNSVHRIVIDGELLTFLGNGSAAAKADTNHPPVTTGHATFDAPAYLYLCGGRNRPAMDYGYATPGWAPIPVHLVISLTAPDPLGYPSADLAIATPTISFPRAACCYVGVAFCAAGAVTNVPSFYADDWIYSSKTVPTADLKGFLMPPQAATNAYAACAFPGVPAVSDAVDLSVYYYTTPADQGFFSTENTSAGNFAKFLFTNSYGYSVGHKLAIPAIPFAIYVMSTGGNGTMIVVPAGYKMNVPRLAR